MARYSGARMPVEAVHLSAFSDSLARSGAPRSLREAPLEGLGRLGALVIDFPYFDHFPLGVLRYLLKRPTARSVYGDLLHHGTPVALATALLARVRTLRATPGTRDAGERVLALALGYVSHLAVDRTLHPLVNRLARARAARLGGDPLHQHTEVEKFQSVLFHEERLGFDFMGEPALRAHIAVDAHAIHRDAALRAAFIEAMGAAIGRAPSPRLLKRWARGYRQYVWLVSSPVGKTIVPEAIKREVRDEVYGGSWGTFVAAYGEAVGASREALDAALALAESSEAAARFDRILPEGPIDHG